jgi:hypothetical protein
MLETNPFYVLQVSTRDNRQTILRQAEEKALELDYEVCQQARADLTHPRRRLGAEIAWLPGLSPREVGLAFARLNTEPQTLQRPCNLPLLALFNLLVAAFSRVNASDTAQNIAAYICRADDVFDNVTDEQVLEDINADRIAAGFPEWTDLPEVQRLLHEHLRQARTVFEATLDRLPPATLLESITLAVDTATDNGAYQAGALIDALIDSYALRVSPLLEQEAALVRTLLDTARTAAESGESTVQATLERIDKVTRNWDRFAQPIQLSDKARGRDHALSKELARDIRSLAIELFNDYELLDGARYLTNMLAEVFAELPEMAEIIEQDATTLDEIDARWQAASAGNAAAQEEWARSITYQAEVGLVIKDTLSISPAGISWKGRHYPLDSVTTVRWGAVRNSVNGIPTGTNYTIGFVALGQNVEIELRRGVVYNAFISALWRAVGMRLITAMLAQLRAGQTIQVGGIDVRDDCVILNRARFLRPAEAVALPWSAVSAYSANGAFVIRSRSENKVSAEASYLRSWNAFVLERIVDGAQKKGIDRLSALL